MNSSNTITEPAADFHPGLGPAAKSPRLLFVDDHEFFRDTICAIFIKKGWGCESAPGGVVALLWLTAHPWSFDILITDHQMPGMNGLEFVREVRATTAFSGKILVHSTMLSRGDQAAYARLEVNAIVPKTGNPEPLFKAIEALRRDKQTNHNQQ